MKKYYVSELWNEKRYRYIRFKALKDAIKLSSTYTKKEKSAARRAVKAA